VLISLVSWNNFLKSFNPAEEPLDGTALLVELRIKPDWPPSFRTFPGSPVDRDITFYSSFPIVLTNLPGIVGCICGDDRGTILHFGNLECFEGWFIEPKIMDIGRCNRAIKREAVPIDQSAQFVPLYHFIPIIAD
jgi:hypothetical protein